MMPEVAQIIRVLAAEDTWVYRNFLPEHHEDEHGAIEFTLCGTAAELVKKANDGFDLLLIDNNLPWVSDEAADWHCLRAIGEITKAYGRGGPRKVLWSNPLSEKYMYSFMSYGGDAWLDKNARTDTPADLFAGIRAVIDGERWRERWEESPTRALSEEDHRRICRWRRMIALLDEGATSVDIAEVLQRAAAVIDATTHRIARSLGVDRRDGSLRKQVPAAVLKAGYGWVSWDDWKYDPGDGQLWLNELWPIHVEPV